MTYTVSITNALAASNNASVDLSIGDIDTNTNDYANFSAAVAQAVVDYNAGSNSGSLNWDGTTLVFTAAVDGDTLTGLTIELDAVDDSFLEGPEVYDITLANPGSTTGILVDVDSSLDNVVTTINDTQGDGGAAEQGGEWFLTGPVSTIEGNALTFTVRLTGNLQAGESTTIQLSVTDIDTTGSDYSNISTAVNSAVITYNANPTNSGILSWDGTFLTFVSDGTGPLSDFDFTINAIDDLLIEGDEQLRLSLSNPSSTTGLSPTLSPTSYAVTTTISDNDVPEFSIQGPTIVGEATNATYRVSLDGVFQSGESVTININITDIDTTNSDYGDFLAAVIASASSNPDVSFNATTGTLIYVAPSNGATMDDLIIELPINSDGVSEGPEDFNIALNAPASPTGLTPAINPTANNVTTTINGSPVTNPDSGFTNIESPFHDPDATVMLLTDAGGVTRVKLPASTNAVPNWVLKSSSKLKLARSTVPVF